MSGDREGPTPEWPFGVASEMEARFWAREWQRPQAVMWERNGQVEEVALYVRALAVAQEVEASTASRTLVRQQQEALGISIPGLHRNRWRIAVSADAKRAASASKSKSRLRVVPGGVDT